MPFSSTLQCAACWSAIGLAMLLVCRSGYASEAEAEPEMVLEEQSADDSALIEELTYQQQPGLPPAASKIFFAKKKYSISGFGELAHIHYFGDKNRSSGDLELYNTNLYRFVSYIAYRATPWMVLYAEIFAEYFHDGLREGELEWFPEVFVDFVISQPFNLRVGLFQVPIGFINNDDEPVQFYSVNRPEVERVIIPSQWIDLGAMAYGSITPELTWMLAGFQGVDGRELLGSTWIRQGRHLRWNFRTLGGASKLNYTPTKNLELSLSGVYMHSGAGERVVRDGQAELVRAPTVLGAAYARYHWKYFTLMALGTYGSMGQTDLLYLLTQTQEQGAQALGSRVYGYYFELGFDVLSAIRGQPTGDPVHKVFYRTDELQVPLFVRYERLDTHARIDDRLQQRLDPGEPIFRSDLDVVTVGVNFKPRRNVVVKANYQFRHNRARGPGVVQEGNRFETGLGFIF